MNCNATGNSCARAAAITAEPRLIAHFRALIGGDRLVAANRSRYAALEAVLEEDVVRLGA